MGVLQIHGYQSDFNNGVILQFGNQEGLAQGTITFPTSFTSTNFSVVTQAIVGTKSQDAFGLTANSNAQVVGRYKVTSFDFVSYNYIIWLCIGY